MRYLHSTEVLFSVAVWVQIKINDRPFDGSTSYLKTVKHLQADAGKTSNFSEFIPTCFPFRETMYLLMSSFLWGGNCVYFSGTFIYYMAGISDAFNGVTLYMTLNDTYLTRLLFQRIESPTSTILISHLNS